MATKEKRLKNIDNRVRMCGTYSHSSRKNIEEAENFLELKFINPKNQAAQLMPNRIGGWGRS